jgi:dihydroorotase
MDDLLFTDARILTEKGIIEGSLEVKDEKIAVIGHVSGREAKRSVDIGGKLIAPGLVDLHVHFREPGSLVSPRRRIS